MNLDRKYKPHRLRDVHVDCKFAEANLIEQSGESAAGALTHDRLKLKT